MEVLFVRDGRDGGTKGLYGLEGLISSGVSQSGEYSGWIGGGAVSGLSGFQDFHPLYEANSNEKAKLTAGGACTEAESFLNCSGFKGSILRQEEAVNSSGCFRDTPGLENFWPSTYETSPSGRCI
jgi:hypothetical protein